MSIARSLKILASDSLIYGLSGILTRFIGVFLTPVYTRVFTPSDYGIIGVLSNGYVLLTIVLIFALDNSTARWFYDTESYKDRKKIINTWIWFYFSFSILAAVGLLLSADFWMQLLLPEYPNSSIYIKILAISLPFVVIPSIAVNTLRFDRKAKQSVALSVLQSLLLIFFNVLFVLILKWGLIGIYYAQLSSAIIILPVAAYQIRNWLGWPKWFDKKKFQGMFKYAIPFIPASIGFWVVNLSGVFFINEYLDKSEVGLFQIGISIAAVAALATTAFQKAWSPFSFSILKEPNAKEVYAATLNIYVLSIGALCTLISLFAYEGLVLLTTPKYYPAASTASILAFNYFLMGLSKIADLGASISKKSAPLGFITMISAGVLVLLNINLIPIYGKEGAAFSICFSQLIIPVYMFWKSQKLYKIPYEFMKNLLVFLVFIICVILSYQFFIPNLVLNFLMKLGFLSVTIGVIALLNRKELAKIVVLFKNKFDVSS